MSFPFQFSRRQMFRAAKALGLGSLIPGSALAATQGASGARRTAVAAAVLWVFAPSAPPAVIRQP